MSWYLVLVVLHVLAAVVWFGHMFFWSLIAGFVTKSIEPRETGQLVRELGLAWGGFGWPALFVLGVTGVLLIVVSDVTLEHVLSGEFLQDPVGRAMTLKLSLVGGMVLYQWFVGHKPAPRLIYLNMAAALMVIALSVLRVRSPW
jgi:hypothetical protein